MPCIVCSARYIHYFTFIPKVIPWGRSYITFYTEKETTTSGRTSLGPWGSLGSWTSHFLWSSLPPICTSTLGYNLPWMWFRLLKIFCVSKAWRTSIKSMCGARLLVSREFKTPTVLQKYSTAQAFTNTLPTFSKVSLPSPIHTLLLFLIRKLDRITLQNW